MKYSLKGHKDRNRHKNRIKSSEQARLVYVFVINHNIPPREGELAGTRYAMLSWCFKPSQPQRIISGLTETFHKEIYIDETTNKAEIRPEEQHKKAESCFENFGMEYS